jgi:Rap1a immunity proteins
MNRWVLSACFLALTAAPVAAADVRLDSYRNPKNETVRNFYQLYLDGVRSGLMASNAWIRSRGGQLAFCMPGNLAMTTEQTEDIMLKSADKRAAKGDMLIASLLLWGLQDTFPCEKTGSQ